MCVAALIVPVCAHITCNKLVWQHTLCKVSELTLICYEKVHCLVGSVCRLIPGMPLTKQIYSLWYSTIMNDVTFSYKQLDNLDIVKTLNTT